MAYLVKKIINKHPYYYLKESKRHGNKVSSKNIAYFGKKKPSPKEIKEKLIEIKEKVVPNKDNIFKDGEKTKVMLNINDIATFCKKKGFVYQTSEIYGGFSGFFDYGHLGAELKNNIKQNWWKTFVQDREDVVGIDGSIISHPKVWEASGHLAGFSDFIYTCDKCKAFSKGDNDQGMKCSKCGNELKNPSKFNLMFATSIGPSKESTAYLRPETAQQMFTNFKLVAENARLKLPFGIAQIGRAFRNEISPRDFLFRSREFEQMEIEYFVHPDKIDLCPYIKEVEDLKVNILTSEMQSNSKSQELIKISDIINKKLATPWHAYWLGITYNWFLCLGIKEENLRVREHLKDELAHYARACFDIEYQFPFGWKEIHGCADRQQFDLNQHIKFSKTDLSLFDEETKQKVVPYVAAEPSQGVDRAFLAFLIDSYNDDPGRGNIVLKIHPKLSPYKAAVFPLVNKLEKEARAVYETLRKDFNCFYDKSGSVGRRYARADEIGIPFCITVDFQTKDDSTVTIRNRDTTGQIRVKIKDLKLILIALLEMEKLENFGKIVK